MTVGRNRWELPAMPGNSPKDGLITSKMASVAGPPTRIGKSFGQGWESGRTTSAGIVSGNALPIPMWVVRSPTLDHFRPISRFPHLAYEWSNWVFSCQRCNVDNKQDRWPTDGFVDPCDSDISERPEQYFTYDWLTGEVLPREDLSENARRKARDTIIALDLNRRDVLELRFDWVWQFFFDLFDENTVPVSARDLFIRTHAGQPIKPSEFSGVTGMFVEQLRRAGSI